MKARALRRGLVTGLIVHEQTTRLTGGFDFIENCLKKSDTKERLYMVMSAGKTNHRLLCILL